MEVNRRGFLGMILAAGAAPVALRANTLTGASDWLPADPWRLNEELTDFTLDGSGAFLSHRFERPGSLPRWIERQVLFDPALDEQEAIDRAHRELRAVAPLIFGAFQELRIVHAWQFETIKMRDISDYHS